MGKDKVKPVGNVPIPFAAMSDAVDEEDESPGEPRRRQRGQGRCRRTARCHAGARPSHTAAAQLLVFGFQRLPHRPIQDTHSGGSAYRRPGSAHAAARACRPRRYLSIRTPPGFAHAPGPVCGTATGLLGQGAAGGLPLLHRRLGSRFAHPRRSIPLSARRIELPRAARALLLAVGGVVLQVQPHRRRAATRSSPAPTHVSRTWTRSPSASSTVTPHSGGNEWSTRLEFYRQESKAPAEQLIGNQTGIAQMPDFDAIILQFSYHFKL